MSSDGGDGDETIYGFLPGSIEPYVSWFSIKIFHPFLNMQMMKHCLYEMMMNQPPENTHAHTHTNV